MQQRLKNISIICGVILVAVGAWWVITHDENGNHETGNSTNSEKIIIGGSAYKDACALLPESDVQMLFSGLLGSMSIIQADQPLRSIEKYHLQNGIDFGCYYQSSEENAAQQVSVRVEYFADKTAMQNAWSNYLSRTKDKASSLAELKDVVLTEDGKSPAEKLVSENINGHAAYAKALGATSNPTSRDEYNARLAQSFQGSLLDLEEGAVYIRRGSNIVTVRYDLGGASALNPTEHPSMAAFENALNSIAAAAETVGKNYEAVENTRSTLPIRHGQKRIGSAAVINPCSLLARESLHQLGGQEADPKLLAVSTIKDTTITTTAPDGYPILPNNRCAFAWGDSDNPDRMQGVVMVDYAASRSLLANRYAYFSDGQKQIKLTDKVTASYHQQAQLQAIHFVFKDMIISIPMTNTGSAGIPEERLINFAKSVLDKLDS